MSDGQGSFGEVIWGGGGRVSLLSCRRGVETLMEEAGFVLFFSFLSISSQLLLLFAYI